MGRVSRIIAIVMLAAMLYGSASLVVSQKVATREEPQEFLLAVGCLVTVLTTVSFAARLQKSLTGITSQTGLKLFVDHGLNSVAEGCVLK